MVGVPAISEKEFMAQVLSLARVRGWMAYHTHDSRRSPDGFPDLVLIRPIRAPQLIVAELKRSAKEQPTLDQQKWLAAFTAAGVPSYVWFPECWSEVLEVLQ